MVVTRFELTPQAFANFSPGFERSENPGSGLKILLTLKGFARRETLSGFNHSYSHPPGFERKREPWVNQNKDEKP
jgi:hypothetical protein